jgi:hypothetical protein
VASLLVLKRGKRVFEALALRPIGLSARNERATLDLNPMKGGAGRFAKLSAQGRSAKYLQTDLLATPFWRKIGRNNEQNRFGVALMFDTRTATIQYESRKHENTKTRKKITSFNEQEVSMGR